jgi:flagellar capping protein FliD
MNQHTALQKNNNIFTNLAEHAKQIEQHWTSVYQGICGASNDHPHLDMQRFDELNTKFQTALQRLLGDLESPTLILATTGTTSSGKSTIVNLLCGADLMPRMAQEMSAGVVYIHHSSDNKRYLKVHETDGAPWECGEWYDLSDAEIREKLTKVMDEFNKSKGISQPATPHIELTYPLACFNNPELLALTSLPKSTQFKLMDLPGLRNHQDNTNAEVIKNCRDALCLVAYNMEETDESRRLELVQQILQQIKHMGGSPTRMLFVLNRIDVFHKDGEGDRRRDEHIDKVKTEIKDILYEELPEHRDTLDNLTYSPLSSLPALHAQRIKTGSDCVQAADELDTHFNSLIPAELIDDLPRRISAWKDHDFERISEVVWQKSYGAEFFATLDGHIQGHFPILVIPSIVKRFEKEVSDAIGEALRTCYSELNSSEEAYNQACERLHLQNSELREFLDKAQQTLSEPFDYLAAALKKNDHQHGKILQKFVKQLLETEVYQGVLTDEKLAPLFSWRFNLRQSSVDILDAMKKSVDTRKRDFSKTTVENLPERLQQQLASACKDYCDGSGNLDNQLENFLNELNNIVDEVITMQSELENSRIHDTVTLLMTEYLNYLRDGIATIAPEWSLTIGDYVLDTLARPEIKPARLKGKLDKHSYEERIWWSLWLSTRTIHYQTLPSSSTLHEDGLAEIFKKLDSLVTPFHNRIHTYIDELNQKIAEEQEKVLTDFGKKLKQANEQHHVDYEKVVERWNPLHKQSEQLAELLSQLARHWEAI